MPIYEYRCDSCGSEFEHLHKRLNEPAPPCPSCGQTEIKKLLSTFSAAVAQKPLLPPCAQGACPSKAGPSRECVAGGCPLG